MTSGGFKPKVLLVEWGLLPVLLSVLMLIIANLEGFERLNVVDLVQDGPEVLDDVGAQGLDVLLSEREKFFYKLSLILLELVF